MSAAVEFPVRLRVGTVEAEIGLIEAHDVAELNEALPNFLRAVADHLAATGSRGDRCGRSVVRTRRPKRPRR